MSLRRLMAVARKEIQHIWRDRSTTIMVLLSPTLVLIIFAYALTAEIHNVPFAVLDYDRSQESRAFVQQINAGPDLELYTYVESLEEIETLLLKGDIKAALIFAPDFSYKVLSRSGIPLQIIIDGTEPESGAFAVDHIGTRVEAFASQILAEELQQSGAAPQGALKSIDLRVRTWYNPSLKPRMDLIPGLISIVLGFPALSVALAIAHEREHGTLEQLLATPIGRAELLLGKMIPYIFVGLISSVVIPLLAIAWFHIPFNGNFLVFLLLSAVFLFAILSMGIIVGVFIHSQAAALALSFLLIFFPGFFLTGIFFPISSLPEVMRMEALVLPGTHYAIITRSIFLQGVGLETLWPYAAFLLALGAGFTAVAALFFRKKLA